MADSTEQGELSRFYERAYTEDQGRAMQYARWRALGAVGKADHVIALCSRAGLAPASTVEVGCGDGALLTELHRRGFGGRLAGVEIAQAAVDVARARDGIESVTLFDGEHLPFEADAFALGILSHVLEHVPDPSALLAEVARVCPAVLLEVPLEANWSARRSAKREHAAEIGHLQRLDRAAARGIVGRAGLVVAGELEDPLPLAAHSFFAAGASERAAAHLRWTARRAALALAPALARRSFTLHYACLAVRPAA